LRILNNVSEAIKNRIMAGPMEGGQQPTVDQVWDGAGLWTVRIGGENCCGADGDSWRDDERRVDDM